jgi:hypothetical protein
VRYAESPRGQLFPRDYLSAVSALRRLRKRKERRIPVVRSDYFIEAKDLDEVEKKALDKLRVSPVESDKPTYVLQETEYNKGLNNVKKEIKKIKNGTSKLIKGAINQDKKMLAIIRLERLEEDTTIENLREFLSVARQDFGARIANQFKEWFLHAFKRDR